MLKWLLSLEKKSQHGEKVLKKVLEKIIRKKELGKIKYKKICRQPTSFG